MAVGGFAVDAPSTAAGDGKITLSVIITCFVAASSALIFGYDIGISAVATHAVALSPELYLKSVLPNTHIPQSISLLLHPLQENEANSVGIGIQLISFCYKPSQCRKSPSTDNKNNVFFLEKDLKADHKMKLLFEKASNNQPSFLPRQVVKSIPFSSTKMDEILNKFGVKPGSKKAEVMKKTIELCEESGIRGEDKYCVTSLESMLDFTISKLGKNIQVMSTEVIRNENT